MLELPVDGLEVLGFGEELQGVGVHAQVEKENAFVEIQVGLVENVPLLDAEPFSWVDLLLGLLIAVSRPLAGLFQRSETAIVESRMSISQFDRFLEVFQTKVELFENEIALGSFKQLVA